MRGHKLVDAALNTILIADSYNVPVPTVQNSVDQDDKLLNKNAIVEQGDIFNTDIVEIPANDSTNDSTNLTKAKKHFWRINIMYPKCFRPVLLKYDRTLKKLDEKKDSLPD